MLAPLDPVDQGRAAWMRLQERHRTSWDDWSAVAIALRVGRDAALAASGTSRPYGKRYTQCYGNWLVRHGFNTITRACRYRLSLCIDHLAEIEGFRASLPEEQRARLAHPDSVYYAWRRSLDQPTRKYSRPDRPTLRRIERPGGDMIKRVAAVMRAHWTADTFRLACIAIEAVLSDPDFEALRPRIAARPVGTTVMPTELHA